MVLYFPEISGFSYCLFITLWFESLSLRHGVAAKARPTKPPSKEGGLIFVQHLSSCLALWAAAKIHRDKRPVNWLYKLVYRSFSVSKEKRGEYKKSIKVYPMCTSLRSKKDWNVNRQHPFTAGRPYHKPCPPGRPPVFSGACLCICQQSLYSGST